MLAFADQYTPNSSKREEEPRSGRAWLDGSTNGLFDDSGPDRIKAVLHRISDAATVSREFLLPISLSLQYWLSLVGVVAEGLISPSLPFVKEQDLTILQKLLRNSRPESQFCWAGERRRTPFLTVSFRPERAMTSRKPPNWRAKW